MTYVVTFENYDHDLAFRLGGKGASLGQLTTAGFPVPPGFTVTTDAHRAVWRSLEAELNAMLAALDSDDLAALARTSSLLRRHVEATPVPEAVRSAVVAAYRQLCLRCGTAEVPVAVRSSATGEDSAYSSFAGQYDTYLWVRGEVELLAAMRRCWSSLYSEQAIAYRRNIGLAEDGVAMGVTVQEMVQPRAAGVAFTLNPEDGDRSQIAIDASWGFGEAIAAGEVTPDSYLVDKVLFQITRRIVSDKSIEHVLTAEGRGVTRALVPDDRRRIPCVSDADITAVAHLTRHVEQHYGCPQDIEWAIEPDLTGVPRVLLLQSRPETVWSKRLAGSDEMVPPSGYEGIVSTLLSLNQSEAAVDGPARFREPGFPNPLDVQTPVGAEGWQELYTYSAVFSVDRQDQDAAAFWFQDSAHWPRALAPWDATFLEYAAATMSQYNTRHYLVPTARGINYRILNGYAYLAPVQVSDPAEIDARVPQFLERAGFYFSNWEDLYDKWLIKIRTLIGRIRQIQFEELPEKEQFAVITEGRGTGSGLTLTRNYHDLLDLCLTLWMHHFEFLNLGYAAYLDFFGFCKTAFNSISDQAIAKMVSGVDLDLYRPDEELKKLAQLAVALDIDHVFSGADQPTLVDDQLRGTPPGERWLDAWKEASEPWFNFSSGSGFYHYDKIWIEHREIPYGFIRDYAARVRNGEDLARPLEHIREERERIVSEYADLLPTAADRTAFDERLRLARRVFPYVENHGFYIEHWAHSMVWQKMRELGRVLVKGGFLGEESDIFYLKRNEIPDVLWDLYSGWAVGAAARGPLYWPAEIERRRRIVAVLDSWSAPPALGVPPAKVTEPSMIMLWGINSECITRWLAEGTCAPTDELTGMAASPGLAEGPARVILSAVQINEVRDGEILVAPLLTPSWGPILCKIAAVVVDVGGIMSHAAIVCREYGVPAVTGTATGTKRISTGMRICVDGNKGVVTILD